MDFHLPELGEGVYEGEFVSWAVKPGDSVRSGQTLCEVMTDKATMEVPSPFAGTVGELRASPGKKVKVGDVLLTYTPAGDDLLYDWLFMAIAAGVSILAGLSLLRRDPLNLFPAREPLLPGAPSVER